MWCELVEAFLAIPEPEDEPPEGTDDDKCHQRTGQDPHHLVGTENTYDTFAKSWSTRLVTENVVVIVVVAAGIVVKLSPA